MLKDALTEAFDLIGKVTSKEIGDLQFIETGTVVAVADGIAEVEGLDGAKADELIVFPNNLLGVAITLGKETVGIALLGSSELLQSGDKARRTGRVVDVPVGEGLLGRVVDVVGRPLDNKGAVRFTERRHIEREAHPIMHRSPVEVPLQTGIKAIDALIPIGRGQRELIIGDRQTGKTAIAVDAIINQKDSDVICIYCAIGQRGTAVARVIDDLKKYGIMDRCVIVNASGEDAAGMQFMAPYAATAIGEYFMEHGRDVLVVYDDLTRHSQAYRQMSLLLRRPPGREAFPGDVFFIHSRLLERSTRLRPEYGGGSLTALPIIETQAQNLSGYVETNLISITDGQIYLNPINFQKGQLPAIDMGRSVSRVGGKAQVPAYRSVAGDLRLSYAQFEELEAFARFGTQLDPVTRKNLTRGERVREILKQKQFKVLHVADQIVTMLAATEGLFDDIELKNVLKAAETVRLLVREKNDDICQKITNREKLEDDMKKTLIETANEALRISGFVTKSEEA
jgi:F-type H+-transporting ATPase subunit alpha